MSPSPSRPPWALTPVEILSLQGTDPSRGLSPAEAARRLSLNGPNEITAQKQVPSWLKFLRQFQSPLVLVLVGAVLLSLFLGDRVDALAIGAILALNAFIGYFQESKAEKAVEALKRMTSPKAKVLRDGAVLEIPSREVALGDLLLIEAGDFVAADARVLEARQLSANEAALTGESLPVIKDIQPLPPGTIPADRVNMLYSGTAISSGSGKGLVTATAMETEFGRIASLLSGTPPESTPLQKRLERISRALLGLCAASVTVVGLLGLLGGQTWPEVMMTSVSLAVAAIPEGLPAVVTLALALSVSRMSKKNALVLRLQAVETLGSTDVICTDKTGTLTTGVMAVREIALEGSIYDKVRILSEEIPSVNAVLDSCVICSTAVLGRNGTALGDSTEIALLQLALEKGLFQEDILKRATARAEWPFDSDRKRMSVAEGSADGIVIHVKGAPEAVLPLCSLSEEQRRGIASTTEELSGLGRRLLAVATRRLDGPRYSMETVSRWGIPEVEKDLEFKGLVSIADPPRTEATQAVTDCKKAGIRVVMITGDHPATAKAIAREMGIMEPGVFDKVLSGAELEKMTDDALQTAAERTAVYARVTPEHKLRIVRAWQALGKVVAMTGDGVNDAPALRQASIGVSMGKGGTEVARQASAMVLADDNFATLVAAVAEGRAIHNNIRQTVQYLLTGNTGEILVMLGAALAGWPLPLLPIHLLWINLVTDGLPALALASEPVPKDILANPKSASESSFSSRPFYTLILGRGALAACLTLAVYGISLSWTDEGTARTHAFSILVFQYLFRSFAFRNDRKTFLQMGIWGNLWLLLAVSIPISFQISLHHVGYLREIFKVTHLPLEDCGILLAIALLPVTLIEVGKLLRKPNGEIPIPTQNSSS